MTNETNKVLNVDTSKAQVSLKDLRTTLKEAKDEMLNAEQGSAEWTAALQKATEAQHTLAETNRIVKGSINDFGAILKNSTDILSGMVGGINAVRGVSAMFGVENEKLMDTLVKLQAGMAVVQGLMGLDGLYKGFKNLTSVIKYNSVAIKGITIVQRAWNAAMAANPIFLIVTVLAAVTAGITGLIKVLKRNNEEQAETNKLLAEEMMYRQKLSDFYDHEVAKLKAMGASEEELLKVRAKNLMMQLYLAKVTEARYKGEYENILKNSEAEKSAVDEAKKNYDEAQKNRVALEASRQKLIEEVELFRIKQQKEAEKADDEAANMRAARREKELEELRKFNEGAWDIITDTYNRQQKLKDDMQSMSSEMIENSISEFDRMMSEEEAYLKKSIDATVKANDEKVKSLEQRMAMEKLIEETTLEHKFAMLNATASLFSAMSELAGNETKRGKSLAITATVINTLAAAFEGYRAAFKPVPTAYSPILGGIYAAAATATGIAQIAKLKAVQVPKGTSPATTSSVTPMTITPPKMQSRIEPVGQFGNNGQEEDIQPVQAYVVESDIRNKSERLDGIAREATF